MIAIVSDLHGNLEAATAVMEDMENQGVEKIICLGDVVGYGPNPLECLDIAMKFDVSLKGNHEKALLFSAEGTNFNDVAREAINWTREQLGMRTQDQKSANSARWDFLGDLKDIYEDGGISFVHGTPRYPTLEYLYKRDINFPEKMEAIFDFVDKVCFVGHTHMPGIWTEDGVYISTWEANQKYRLTAKKTVINVGSVGQPRDGDSRACYVLLNEDAVFFRRIQYPVEQTYCKIKAIASLDPILAERLLVAK